MTHEDPDHSVDERRFITIGHRARVESCWLHMRIDRLTELESCALDAPRNLKAIPTTEAARHVDALRPEYDWSSLKGGIRGKYDARATPSTTLVLLEPDGAAAFRSGRGVNGALRGKGRTGPPNKRLQPAPRKTQKARPHG